MKDNTIDFKAVKSAKEFMETALPHIHNLERTLYDILDATDLYQVKLMAAEALGEDLATYEEADDLQELDFNDDERIDWDTIDEISAENGERDL